MLHSDMTQAATCILVSISLLIVYNYCILYILCMGCEPAIEINWIEIENGALLAVAIQNIHLLQG